MSDDRLNAIADDVIRVIQAKYGYGPDELTATTAFEELGFDSLVFIELAVALEGSYGVPLTEADVAGTGSVAELSELLAARSSSVAAA